MGALIVKSCNNGEAANDCCPFYSESSASCNILGRRVMGEFTSDNRPADCPLLDGPITVELEDDDEEDEEFETPCRSYSEDNEFEDSVLDNISDVASDLLSDSFD